ncbi:MAG: PH domain-containing protein [Thermodesulfobacteriota bacterium]
MSYVSRSLMPGETVVEQVHLHWIIFFKSIAILFVAIALFLYGHAPHDPSLEKLLKVIAGIFLVAAILSGIINLIEYWTTEIAVTNRRVILKKGLIWRKSKEIILPQVESILVDQDIPGRILGYSSIQVVGSGGTIERFHFIANPMAFRDAVHAEIMRVQFR